MATTTPNVPLDEQDTKNHYFFTITLKPEIYSLTVRQQYRKAVNQLINKLSEYEFWEFTVEICPKNGNIHFHGIVKMYGLAHIPKCRFKDKFKGTNIFGFTQCDEVKNMKNSRDYILKETTITDKIINGDPEDINYVQKEKYPVYFVHNNKYKNYQESILKRIANKTIIRKPIIENLDKDIIIDMSHDELLYKSIMRKVDDVLYDTNYILHQHKINQIIYK